MMPPAPSTRHFWSRKKVPPRPFGPALRCSRRRACRPASTPIAAATTSSLPRPGQAVDKERLTQVGRALDRLGIEHIAAYSPEARGRSERMFGTLQDRLAKELKLAGMADIKAANRFISEVYLPDHN